MTPTLPPGAAAIVPHVDHLVVRVPSLEAAEAWAERHLDARPAPGGRHPGAGTHNALLGVRSPLGDPPCYLEFIAPDPTQPEAQGRRFFGADAEAPPGLYTWAARGTNLPRLAEAVGRGGLEVGAVLDGQRLTPDGTTLRWTLTDPRAITFDGLRPFFIDWGSTPHPASTLPLVGTLVGLWGLHPQVTALADDLQALALPLPVQMGPTAGLWACIETAAGAVMLGPHLDL
ncbi:MAG: VOC family protein [Bacteroidota bacterium]